MRRDDADRARPRPRGGGPSRGRREARALGEERLRQLRAGETRPAPDTARARSPPARRRRPLEPEHRPPARDLDSTRFTAASRTSCASSPPFARSGRGACGAVEPSKLGLFLRGTVARVSVSFAGHELHSPRFALADARELARERLASTARSASSARIRIRTCSSTGASSASSSRSPSPRSARRTDLQNRAMVHLAERLALEIPRPVAAVDGKECRGRARRRDVLVAARDDIEGEPLIDADTSRRRCSTRSARPRARSPARSRTSSTRRPIARCSGTRATSAPWPRRSRRMWRIRAGASSCAGRDGCGRGDRAARPATPSRSCTATSPTGT